MGLFSIMSRSLSIERVLTRRWNQDTSFNNIQHNAQTSGKTSILNGCVLYQSKQQSNQCWRRWIITCWINIVDCFDGLTLSSARWQAPVLEFTNKTFESYNKRRQRVALSGPMAQNDPWLVGLRLVRCRAKVSSGRCIENIVVLSRCNGLQVASD